MESSTYLASTLSISSPGAQKSQFQVLSTKISTSIPCLLFKKRENYFIHKKGDHYPSYRDFESFEAEDLYHNKKSAYSMLNPEDVSLTVPLHPLYKIFYRRFSSTVLDRRFLESFALKSNDKEGGRNLSVLTKWDFKIFDKIKKFSIQMPYGSFDPGFNKYLTAVEKLNISIYNRSFSDIGNEYLFRTMISIRNLRELSLDLEHSSTEINSLLDLINRNPNLASISIKLDVIIMNLDYQKKFQEALSHNNELRRVSFHPRGFKSVDSSEISFIKIYSCFNESMSFFKLEQVALSIAYSRTSNGKTDDHLKLKSILMIPTLKDLTLNLDNNYVETNLIDVLTSSSEVEPTQIKKFSLKVMKISGYFFEDLSRSNTKEYQKKIPSILRWMPCLIDLEISMPVDNQVLISIANEINELKLLESFQLNSEINPRSKENHNQGFNYLLKSLYNLTQIISLNFETKGFELSDENLQILANCLKRFEKFKECRLAFYHPRSNQVLEKIVSGLDSFKNLEVFDIVMKDIYGKKGTDKIPKNQFEELKALNRFLLVSESLKTLKISHINLIQKSKEDLMEFASIIGKLKNLEEFYLNIKNTNSALPFQGFETLCESFTNLKILKKIKFAFTFVRDTNSLFLSLADRITRLRHLRQMEIIMNSGNKDYDDGLLCFAKNFSLGNKNFHCYLSIDTELKSEKLNEARSIAKNLHNLHFSPYILN